MGFSMDMQARQPKNKSAWVFAAMAWSAQWLKGPRRKPEIMAGWGVVEA